MKRHLALARPRPLIFVLACLGTAGMLFISELSYRRSVATLDELGRFASARASTHALTQGLADAESGRRGYLLNARAEDLEPVERALRGARVAVESLRAHYAGDLAHRTTLDDLHRLVESTQAELQLSIRLFDEGDRPQALAMRVDDASRQRMEAIRAIGAALLAHEVANVAQGRRGLYATLMLSRVGVALLCSVSLLALLLVLRQAAAGERQQREVQHLVRAERDRLEVDVAQRTVQLTQLARHLQSAREDERGRLARDLHDELGALLTSAKLDAARIRARLGTGAPDALERLVHLVATLDQVIALKRRIAEDLRPSALGNLGLVVTLEILAREFTERSGVAVRCELNPVALSADAELTVYRLVQEAINNLTKHARATQVWLQLGPRDGGVEVSVRDDGVGFDTRMLQAASHGLLGMRFRVEAEGGTLDVVSSHGQGTQVTAWLPAALGGA